MTRVLAVANQKGGVAKTTTSHTLGVALARRGRRVLLVDFDPQGCLTFSCGVDPEALDVSVHDALLGRNKLDETLVDLGEFRLAPANIDLAGAEQLLLGRTGRDFALRETLADELAQFDDVVIDCAPSLGILTVNALTAATEVVIPLQCEALSHRGVAQLLDTIAEVRKYTNPALVVRGVVATMYDARTRHSREVLDDVQSRFGLDLVGAPVPKSVRFAEAPLRGVTILDHAADSPGARAYTTIADTLLGSGFGTET